MDEKRWERIQLLFHKVADWPAFEQQLFLRTECREDETLLLEVLEMVEQDKQQPKVLDGDVSYLAQQALNAPLGTAYYKDFGPYRIKKLLGEGGMGLVYLAERKDLGSLVAIKVMRDTWLSSVARERFATEQKTLAQLDHPSIARLYDADVTADGTPWFAMEYVDGAPLTEYCRNRKSPTEKRLMLIGLVCEAIQYAHEHAIIHRDLKPSNILVKNDGSIRLLDFGIAKQLESPDEFADQTKTAFRPMTPAYAAPEQICGARIGTRSDVYSLGIILYELLTNRLPYDLADKTPGQIEMAIALENPQKPSTVARTLSAPIQASTRDWADLDVLCLTAMNKDSERRYRSAEALRRDINHYLKGEPLEARADGWAYRTGKFAIRNRRPLAAATAVIAVVLALVVFFALRLSRARDAALAQAERMHQIEQVMLNLFDGGDKEAGPMENLRAVDVLERGVKEARGLRQQPGVQADLYATLGKAFQNLGKFDRADSLLQSALDRNKERSGPESPQVAQAEITLGLLRVEEGKLQPAEQLIREGLATAQVSLQPGDPGLAEADEALGELLASKGDLKRALPAMKAAVQIQSKAGPFTAEYAKYLNSLGVLQTDLGEFNAANLSLSQALELNRKLFGSLHPKLGDGLMNLGSVQFELGHYSKAARYYVSALDIAHSWYGPQHYKTGDVMALLGQTILEEGHYVEAARLLEKALVIQQQAYGQANIRVAQTLNSLATVAQNIGRFDEAEAYFQRALATEQAIYGDKHYLIAVELNNLAVLYRKQGRYVHAEELNREAVQRFSEALPLGHPYVAKAQISLGETLIAEKRFREAEQPLLAGYQTLLKQVQPFDQALKRARLGLAAVYEALHETNKANQYRTEIAKPPVS